VVDIYHMMYCSIEEEKCGTMDARNMESVDLVEGKRNANKS
jgi:hypothetical protein